MNQPSGGRFCESCPSDVPGTGRVYPAAPVTEIKGKQERGQLIHHLSQGEKAWATPTIKEQSSTQEEFDMCPSAGHK